MEVNEAIRTKRAIRKFTTEGVSSEEIEKILNAGRLAQSAKNSQPWHFIVMDDRRILKELSKLGHFAGHISGATFAVAIITPPPEQRFSIMFDAGQAAAYMQLAAWEIGIGSCLATIYQTDPARDLLGFPDDLEIRIAISFGYPAEKFDLTRKLVKGGRRKFEEVVHWNTW